MIKGKTGITPGKKEHFLLTEQIILLDAFLYL